MTRRTGLWLAAFAALALTSAGPAPAADAPKGAADMPSAEQRQKMADAHQKMADCLRSDRPIGECRSEMNDSAPMMGHGHGGMAPGAMGHGMGSGMMESPQQPMKK